VEEMLLAITAKNSVYMLAMPVLGAISIYAKPVPRPTKKTSTPVLSPQISTLDSIPILTQDLTQGSILEE